MKYLEKYWKVIVAIFVVCMFLKPTICVFIIGAPLFYAGVMSILFLQRIQKTGVLSAAKILQFESDDEGYKTPLIEFVTTKGETVTAKPFVYMSTDLSKLRSYKNLIGTPVDVIYDPDEPVNFVLAGEKTSNYLVCIIFSLFGLACIVLSICFLTGLIKSDL